MKEQTVDLIELCVNHIPKRHALQKVIEMNVTNGLGYDSRTFADGSYFHDILGALHIHLAELGARIDHSRRLNDLIVTSGRLEGEIAYQISQLNLKYSKEEQPHAP